MGAAAYNRGSRAISAQIDRDLVSSHNMRVLRGWTDYSAAHAGRVGFAETVVRFHPDGTVVLMNRQAGGWGAYGYTYRSMWALARQWRLAFVGLGEDEHSRFVRVVPLGRKETQ